MSVILCLALGVAPQAPRPPQAPPTACTCGDLCPCGCAQGTPCTCSAPDTQGWRYYQENGYRWAWRVAPAAAGSRLWPVPWNPALALPASLPARRYCATGG